MIEISKSKTWQTARLGELCSITTGDKDVNEGVPKGRYPFFTCAEEIFSFDSYSFDGDAILIAGNGNFSVKKYSGKFEAYQRTYVLQDFKIEYPFIFYYIFHKLRDITRDNRGTTVRYIRIGNLQDYDVCFPSIAEQKRIVCLIDELLSDLDSAVDNLKKSGEQLRIYRHSVLNQITEGKDFVQLGDLIDQPKYGTARKCQKDVSGKAVLRIPNIGSQHIDLSDLKYAHFTDNEASTYKLVEGDLLMIRSNGSVSLVGKTAIITKKDTHTLYAGYLIRLRPKPDLNSYYLQYILSSPQLRSQIESKAKSTSGVHNINSGEIKSLRIPFCPLKDQLKIVEDIESRFSFCDSLELTINESIKKAESLRQSILKQAFEGTLTEKWCKEHKDLISGKNSAEALLKKIKAEKEALQGKSEGKTNHD